MVIDRTGHRDTMQPWEPGGKFLNHQDSSFCGHLDIGAHEFNGGFK
jgi:hypothetical protein